MFLGIRGVTCPRDFLCVGDSRRETVILFGTSFVVIVSGIRIASRLCSQQMHTLFLVLQSWPNLRPCWYLAVSLDFVTVSDCTHQLVLVDWFVDLAPDALSFLSTSFLVAYKE